MKKPAQAYATVPQLWTRGTCLVLGSGPSLTQADVTYAAERVDGVVAVNDTYKFAPDATALYAADKHWWDWHHGCVAPHIVGRTAYPAFTGQFKYTLSRGCDGNPQLLRKGPETGLTLERDAVALGRNGVYQAINLAMHFGATRILLLGVDMQDKAGAHFFGRHPNNTLPPFLVCMERFTTMVKPLKDHGIEVINCTRSTALKVFPCARLEDMLPNVQAVAV